MVENNTNQLKKKHFDFLPVGTIRPRGWLKEQLKTQAKGLTGSLDEIWDDLGPNNKWLGGSKEGWERGPYYVDGLLPLAYLLDDEELKSKASVWIESFLNFQREDGWIGPDSPGFETEYQYDPWPIFIVFKVLMQYYGVSQDDRVLRVMEGFFRYIEANFERRPLESWAKFRWMDLALSVHWFYEKTGKDWVIPVANKLFEQGYDWTDHFANFKYKEKNLAIKMETHVVNNAMGLKAPAVKYRQTADEHDKSSVMQGINNLDKFHGQVTGVFTGDEHLAGKNPSQGTELCAVVEYMYSLEVLLSILGDPIFGDRLEKIAFNALPASFKPDMWAHQYDQQVNQVLCSVANRDWTNGPDANIFGLEPHFGCCTANYHQGWPKFATSLWMKQEGGLVATAYAPCEVTFKDDSGQDVRIVEDTDYPFGESIRLTIHTEGPSRFLLALRIPSWTKEARVVLPSGEELKADSGQFLKIEETWNDGDVVQLLLPMTTLTSRRYHGALSIERGPLVFSLPIDEDWRLCGGNIPAGDWEVFPNSLWNYGIFLQGGEVVDEIVYEPFTGSPFYPEKAPVKLKVKGALIPQWKLKNNNAGEIPQSPCYVTGKSRQLTLVPYGCTNLRITEFPIIVDID